MDGIQVHPVGMGRAEITVEVSGEVDTATTNDLRGILVNLIMFQKLPRIVVDLRGVTALDSSAIGMLRAAHDVAQDVHRTLVFHTRGSSAADQLDLDGVVTGAALITGDRSGRAA